MSTIKRKALSLVMVFSLFIGMVGMVNVDTSYAASKKIHLKKTSISLVAGKTYQQKLFDKNGKTINARNVKWKSSNTLVAKINNKGKITAIMAGNTKMTAKYKGKTYKFTVKVNELSNLQIVHDYVEENGDTNSNGDKVLRLSLNIDGIDYNGAFVSYKDKVEFLLIKIKNTEDITIMSVVTMPLELPMTQTAPTSIDWTAFTPEPDSTELHFEGHTNMRCSNYTNNTNLAFYLDTSDPEDFANSNFDFIQEQSNTDFRDAMLMWERMLNENIGFNMKDIGFSSYTPE